MTEQAGPFVGCGRLLLLERLILIFAKTRFSYEQEILKYETAKCRCGAIGRGSTPLLPRHQLSEEKYNFQL